MYYTPRRPKFQHYILRTLNDVILNAWIQHYRPIADQIDVHETAREREGYTDNHPQ